MTQVYSKGLKLMGNHFEFSVVSDNEAFAMHCIDQGIAEVSRIEKLLTTFDETSQTNQVNAHAGVMPVKVDKEVFDLIERCIRISSLTQGAFDITYGSIDKSLWNFDRNMTTLPDVKTAKATVRLIDFRKVILDRKHQTVFLAERGMRIGFGGIGKGYAADQAKRIMRAAGVTGGIVNAAGDLTVWGHQPHGAKWTVGIADPNKKDMPFASVQLTDTSIATSGTYEKYVLIDGIRYSHTIDPQTGYPVRGIKSVTVLCASAELADAMATPLMVMGVKAGLHLINQLRDIACIIIDDNDVIHSSKNIALQQV